jgi:hypothetical protein
MSEYPYLESKRLVHSQNTTYLELGSGNNLESFSRINQPGAQGFIISPNRYRPYSDDLQNYSYYAYLERKMKTKSENRLNNNLQLARKYKETKKNQPLTLQCRNSYELKMIHEECERLKLKHETVKIENVHQNKLKNIECTICDHDCRCTGTTQVSNNIVPVYGVKITKLLLNDNNQSAKLIS